VTTSGSTNPTNSIVSKQPFSPSATSTIRSPQPVPSPSGSLELEGSPKGTRGPALLLARWTLDNNGLDGSRILDPADRELADLLVQAAAGLNVEAEILRLFIGRA
jgi:hypothetical protein